MRLRSTLLKILQIETKPIPADPAPMPHGAVKAEDLLNLAVVMRDLWMPDAGFAGEGHRARSIVLAALLRLFPDRAEPEVAESLQRQCGGYCSDCTAPAACQAKRQLDQYLDGIERPALNLPVTRATLNAVRASVEAFEHQLRLDEAAEESRP